VKDRVTVLGTVCKVWHHIVKRIITVMTLRSFDLEKIPSVVLTYTNLTELDINNNKFPGTWPPKEFAHMTQLMNLYMYNNKITSLDPSISTFQNMCQVTWSSNQLTQLPKEIGDCVGLRELFVPYNQLTQLPEEISNLTNLVLLDVSYNKINSLPDGLSKMTHLTYLDVSNNSLGTSVPEAVTAMSNWANKDNKFIH